MQANYVGNIRVACQILLEMFCTDIFNAQSYLQRAEATCSPASLQYGPVLSVWPAVFVHPHWQSYLSATGMTWTKKVQFGKMPCRKSIFYFLLWRWGFSSFHCRYLHSCSGGFWDTIFILPGDDPTGQRGPCHSPHTYSHTRMMLSQRFIINMSDADSVTFIEKSDEWHLPILW